MGFGWKKTSSFFRACLIALFNWSESMLSKVLGVLVAVALVAVVAVVLVVLVAVGVAPMVALVAVDVELVALVAPVVDVVDVLDAGPVAVDVVPSMVVSKGRYLACMEQHSGSQNAWSTCPPKR